jgi:hypothetical protein
MMIILLFRSVLLNLMSSEFSTEILLCLEVIKENSVQQ